MQERRKLGKERSRKQVKVGKEKKEEEDMGVRKMLQ